MHTSCGLDISVLVSPERPRKTPLISTFDILSMLSACGGMECSGRDNPMISMCIGMYHSVYQAQEGTWLYHETFRGGRKYQKCVTVIKV